MCEPLYPAEVFVIFQSKYDGHFWMITSSGKVKKMTNDDIIRELDGCEGNVKVTYCPVKEKLIVWSRTGKVAIGVTNADIFDEDTWCNLQRLADIINDKVPEPVLPSDIEAARFDLYYKLGARKGEVPVVA